jgi:hypothetical protein
MSSAQPIHVAITRRVRLGREAEFEQALREFFLESFHLAGVQGAILLSPLPGTGGRDYGILRSFANEAERDAFYASPAFAAWAEQAREFTEGEPEHRAVHGLEAWFRGSTLPPPRWKMAVLTFLGVYVTTLTLTLLVGPYVRGLPLPLGNAAFNLMVVPLLTWAVMPVITRFFARWLRAA